MWKVKIETYENDKNSRKFSHNLKKTPVKYVEKTPNRVQNKTNWKMIDSNVQI